MFRFDLERVLQHRRREVDAHARTVADAERRLRDAEAFLRDRRAEIRAHDADAAAGRGQQVDPGRLVRDRNWRAALGCRLAASEEIRDEALTALAAAQKELQEAWRAREALERLKARRYEEWKQTEARRQQRELDEVASIRAAIGASTGDLTADGGRRT